jgi:hypothetical protein
MAGILRDLAGKALKEAAKQARSFEEGVQQVVEVISPGPLGGGAQRWDARRRQAAAAAVQQAIARWEAAYRLSHGR